MGYLSEHLEIFEICIQKREALWKKYRDLNLPQEILDGRPWDLEEKEIIKEYILEREVLRKKFPDWQKEVAERRARLEKNEA